jgi:hypothetical protein
VLTPGPLPPLKKDPAMSTNAFTSSQHQPQTNPPRGVQRPSCDTDPEGWTLDRGGLPDWLRAIRTCVTACPLIQQCWETRNRLYAESHPAGVIWAGTAYTETGEPLLTQQALVEYANWRRRRQANPSTPAARAA